MKRSICIFICVLCAVPFILFDAFIYLHFTRRLVNPFGKEMQEKSIVLEDFLPFDENSKIVKLRASDEYLFSEGDSMPVLDGATALYPVYSAFFNAMYPEGTCSFDGKDFREESLLQKRNTGGAFKAIVNKTADIIFCASPSQNQLEYAEQNGVELVLVPIGFEAFVFIVNESNPVQSLTVEQIRDIYSGKIKNWFEVGGDKSLISAITRPEGSGSQTAMISFMNGLEIKPSNSIYSGRTLGYSFRYYVDGIVASKNIKLLSLNGVYPSKENIRNHSYPVVSNFYAIYRKADSERQDIQKVISFALSEHGQQIVEESSYISLN
jgi:phosphate transport system substrate-binding protein